MPFAAQFNPGSQSVNPESRAPDPEARNDGTTSVSLQELIALRARAARPMQHALHRRSVAIGGHRSAVRGRGMDYAESRIYQPGDDVRNIDWRRTARSGKWHTKLFEVERERDLLLLVDTHATLHFGTRKRFKSVAMARAAAWLAWSGVRAGDRIGALAFGAAQAGVDPRAGMRGALAVMGALQRWDRMGETAGTTVEPLSAALERARRLTPAGAAVWLLSDGWCADSGATSALGRMVRQSDLRVVIVVDPLEHKVTATGSFAFATATATRVLDLSDDAVRVAFGERVARGWHALARACDAASVAWTTLATTAEPDVALQPLWRRRAEQR